MADKLNVYTGTTDKPVVHYLPNPYTTPDYKPEVGKRFGIIPVDHPNTDLNGDFAWTSMVVKVNKDGFETRNTIYKLSK